MLFLLFQVQNIYKDPTLRNYVNIVVVKFIVFQAKQVRDFYTAPTVIIYVTLCVIYNTLSVYIYVCAVLLFPGYVSVPSESMLIII